MENWLHTRECLRRDWGNHGNGILFGRHADDTDS